MFHAFVYIATVILVNYGFEAIPPQTLPGGELWPPMSLVVGFTFVIRDFAQREIGHWVIPAMLLGGVISWYMATPTIAIASMTAFLVGEFFDWGIFTVTKKPFSQRILRSSLVGTPIDSAVFLSMMGIASVWGIILMTLSKMVGAFIVYLLVRQKERNEREKGESACAAR